jgi:hypothetical protein
LSCAFLWNGRFLSCACIYHTRFFFI